jgi:hypothetical protein
VYWQAIIDAIAAGHSTVAAIRDFAKNDPRYAHVPVLAEIRHNIGRGYYRLERAEEPRVAPGQVEPSPALETKLPRQIVGFSEEPLRPPAGRICQEPAMLSVELIQWRLENFWGYGSFDAPVWFVGMEEGLSAEDERDICLRFRATYGKLLADIRHDMTEVAGHMRWFRWPFPLQQTIKWSIKLYLFLREGQRPTNHAIAEFQRIEYADGQQTTQLDLMPLPCRKANEDTWFYDNYDLLFLNSRSRYLERYKPIRTDKLRELVRRHQPKIVIFSSTGYLGKWETVSGVTLNKLTRQMYFSQTNHTSFCVITQARGMSNERLYEYADLIRPRLAAAIGSQP